jgi:hypothetical protein
MTAKFDIDSELQGIQLDAHVLVGGVQWNGAGLLHVDWRQMPRVGDEQLIQAAKSREERIQTYFEVILAYRSLSSSLGTQAGNQVRSNYSLRGEQINRRVSLVKGHFVPWLGMSIIELISGYGEKPGRTVAAYLIIIASFIVIYTNFGVVAANCSTIGVNSNGSTIVRCAPAHTLSFQEAFVFSLTSFHGRGFFPGGLDLGSPITFIAAIEAVIGLMVEILLIASLGRRLLSSYS